jgi:cold shock CspA family protein
VPDVRGDERRQRVTARVSGVLETWYHSGGFGFVRPAVGGRSVFIHLSALEDLVDELPHVGDLIEFTQVSTERGPRATDARIVRPRGGARG